MNDTKQIMRIADLPVYLDTKLTPSIQDKLMKIIEQEFLAQSTIYNSEIKLGEEKVLDKYRQLYKVPELLKRHLELEQKQSALNREESEELSALEIAYAKDKARVNKRYEHKSKFIEQAISQVDKKLEDTPFDNKGEHTAYQKSEKGKRAYEELRAGLDAVSLRHPQNLKNKIIARLLIATTTGEAMVILRDVLGNGVLPTLSKQDFLALEDKVAGLGGNTYRLYA